MTILVVGDEHSARAVAGTLEVYHHPVQRCRSASMAIPLLNHYAERYSLILCEQGMDSDALLEHLATIERDTPVVAIGSPNAMTAPAPATSMCSIQRTADGCHRLHCALSEASAQPESHPALAQTLDEQPVAFAYSAPVNPRR